MITRLRLRVAEDKTDGTRGRVCIVNASKVDGKTRLSPISINRYGSIEDWPVGFFDQAASESQQLVMAGLAKREGAGPPEDAGDEPRG